MSTTTTPPSVTVGFCNMFQGACSAVRCDVLLPSAGSSSASNLSTGPRGAKRRLASVSQQASSCRCPCCDIHGWNTKVRHLKPERSCSAPCQASDLTCRPYRSIESEYSPALPPIVLH